MTRLLPLAVLALAACASVTTSQYSGQEARGIKALSAEEVDGYLAGNGMGFAKAAELNGYPGPMHAVDLADELRLTAAQREAATRLLQRHKAEVRELGRGYVDAERDLDRLFATRSIDAKSLDAAVKRSADLQRRIRESHLAAHLELTAMLTPEQVGEYNRRRGYSGHSH